MQASTSSYTPPSESEIWTQSQPLSSNHSLTSNSTDINGSPSSSPELGGRRTLRSRKNGDTPRMTHPLSALTPPTLHTDVLGDVSRPNLMRLTSETERQVAESSASGGSMRGSLDLLRMTPTEAGEEGREVEVLIHTIKPNESLAGIALLYGIDLATLRKSNKLWSSDPLHIRTHLYVPLEACRWNKARETLVRGPGEGQVTLLPKTIQDKGKGKGKEIPYPNGKATLENGILDLTDSPQAQPQAYLPNSSSTSSLSLASTFLPSTNHSYDQHHPSPPTSTEPLASPAADGITPRILDVVRIPSSQLRFFPKPKPDKPPDGRRSLDYFNSKSNRSPASNALSSPLSKDGRPSGEVERRSVEDTLHTSISAGRRNSHSQTQSPDGPTIINDLSTLPPPLRPHSPHQPHSQSYSKGRSKSTIVKIRPPIPQTLHPHQRNPSSGGAMESIKGSIQNFFTVPPPPSQSPFTYNTLGRSASTSASRNRERQRVASSPSTSTLGRNSTNPVVRKQESLELKTRYSELGLDLGLGGLGINVPSHAGKRQGLGRKDSSGGGDKGDKQD